MGRFASFRDAVDAGVTTQRLRARNPNTTPEGQEEKEDRAGPEMQEETSQREAQVPIDVVGSDQVDREISAECEDERKKG